MGIFSPLSRQRPDEELRPVLRRPKKAARVFATAAILLGVLLLTTPRYHVGLVDFDDEGSVKEKVVAQFGFEVEDVEGTEAKRRVIPAKVGKIYLHDPRTTQAIWQDVAKIVQLTWDFERDNETRSEARRAGYEKLSRDIVGATGINLSSSTLATLSGEIRARHFQSSLARMFHRLYEDWWIVEPAYADDLRSRVVRPECALGTPRKVKAPPLEKTLVYPEDMRERLWRTYLDKFYPLAGGREESAILSGLTKLSLALARPNLTFDRALTRKRVEVGKAAVEPVTREFRSGETIIRRGAKPNAFEKSALEQYNTYIQYYRVLRLLAYLFLMLGMLLFLMLYMKRFRPLFPFRTSTIVIVGIPTLVVLFIGRAGAVLLEDHYGDATGYLFPVALLGMLGVILLDTELGIIQVLIGSVLIGLATNMRFEYALPALFGGLTAVASLHRLRQRSQLFRAAIYVAVVSTLTIGLLRFIEDPTHIHSAVTGEEQKQLAFIYAAGTINAALCYFLAIGMFPLFEGLFGITTDLKLLELTGVHHPLLRELEEKAPGSYQHSLNVAKLAEAAADAIGANYLLVRAGAYFHDIGKTLKPRYFSENQISPDDRRTHGKLTPYMSCLIIRNHVKEGIELARRHGVPEKVIDFIPQHHGTCLIKYFYHEAIRKYEESESAEPVREEDFRYPGPKPQSIETAIVMVADSVEATATNRLNRPHVDEDDIRRLVMDAIQDKFGDGQFDDSHLTLRQLHEIRESMVRTLVGRFHHRVDYPSPTAAPAKRGAKEVAAA